jgi:hypothetical protein
MFASVIATYLVPLVGIAILKKILRFQRLLRPGYRRKNRRTIFQAPAVDATFGGVCRDE